MAQAALAMGDDLAYMSTRFIPVRESLACEDYRSALFGATAKDVLFTTALDGFPANFLAPSLEDAGRDLEEVKATPPGQIVDPGKARGGSVHRRWWGRRRAGDGWRGGEARIAWRGEGCWKVVGPARSAAVVALKEQRNRDDDGQNRENQTAAPRASAAVIGTIGQGSRTGPPPRFDLAPLLVRHLPGGEPAEQIHG